MIISRKYYQIVNIRVENKYFLTVDNIKYIVSSLNSVNDHLIEINNNEKKNCPSFFQSEEISH